MSITLYLIAFNKFIDYLIKVFVFSDYENIGRTWSTVPDFIQKLKIDLEKLLELHKLYEPSFSIWKSISLILSYYQGNLFLFWKSWQTDGHMTGDS